MSLLSRIEFMRAGLNVRRYHQHTTLEIDTVGKHSAGVALFVNLIDPTARKEVILHAVFHDLGEWNTGDVPAPTKRALPDEARAIFDKMEHAALYDNGLAQDAIYADEHLLLKIADYFDGLSFAIEERMRGNRTLEHVANEYVKYITELMKKVPESVAWRQQARTIFTVLDIQRKQAYDNR